MFTASDVVTHINPQYEGIPFETVYTEEDKVASKKLLTLWTDFAIHGGNPTPEGSALAPMVWERIEGESPKHLVRRHLAKC